MVKNSNTLFNIDIKYIKRLHSKNFFIVIIVIAMSNKNLSIAEYVIGIYHFI